MSSESEIKIAPAMRRDAPVLGKLWEALQHENAAVQPLLTPSDNAGKWYSEFVRDEIDLHGRHFLIAWDADIPVGFAAGQIVVRPTLAEGRAGVILDIYVDPDYRRRGIGSSLHAGLVDRFRDQGVGRIELQALAAGPAARGFWAKQGYTELFHTLTRALEA